MAICSRCGAENKPEAKVCRMCAERFPLSEEASGAPHANPVKDTRVAPDRVGAKVCAYCGASNEEHFLFCQHCGTKLVSAAPALPVSKSPLAAEAAGTAHPERSTPSRNPNAISCPKCKTRVKAGDTRCPSCGNDLGMEHTIAMSSVRFTPRPRLILIVDGEQTGDEYQLGNETVIGRRSGHITFPHDDYVSSKHVRIVKHGNDYTLVDEGSRNGTFIRIEKETELKPGDLILVGRQLLRFEI